jgi:hypothetical protein
MNKFLTRTVGLGVGLALASFGGLVMAQEKGIEGIVTNADGSYVTSTAGLNPTANGEGGTIIYGDITTGPGYTVIGAPSVSETAPPSEAAPASEPAPDTGSEVPADTGTSDRAVATETDQDADNYPDAEEYNLGLDPTNVDTDADGAADGDELNIYGTDPTAFDSDGDGVSDGAELFDSRTDPLVWDDFSAASAGTETVSQTTSDQTMSDGLSDFAQEATESITAIDGDAAALGTGNADAAPGTVTRGGGGMALLGPDGTYSVSDNAPPTVDVAGDTDVIEVVTPADAPARDTSIADCGSYASWYDAQVAYEAAGMLDADPALVSSLDPDYDGIACEEGM